MDKCLECGKDFNGVSIRGLCVSCFKNFPDRKEIRELDRKMASMAREILELRKVVFYHHYQGCGGCTHCIDYIQTLGNDLSEFFVISPRKLQRHEIIGEYHEDTRNKERV
jgi:hypothetical protein